MALVRKLEEHLMKNNRVHDPVDCTFSIFTNSEGKKYLQLDTYGSSSRKLKGKKSQSLQFDENSLQKLKTIINLVVS